MHEAVISSFLPDLYPPFFSGFEAQQHMFHRVPPKTRFAQERCAVSEAISMKSALQMSMGPSVLYLFPYFDPLKDYATLATHPLQMPLILHSQDLHTPLYTQISYFLALLNLDIRVRSTRT